VSVVWLRLRRWTIKGLSKTHLVVLRLGKGRLLGRLAGMPVLVLTTTGRRSGKRRLTPLTFCREGTDLVVVGSNGGADRAPDWFLNLQQNPCAVVQIGTDELAVRGRTASAAERDRLWPRITATFGSYAKYQARTAREIPVVILTPEAVPADHDGV
jgi:F420H(2)-dependent quinone reductase